MLLVKVGDKIPLSLQVYDGNSELKVSCTLYDDQGNFYMKVMLNHLANGLYVDNSVDMPEFKYILAQYLTDKPMEYEIAQDVFKSIEKVQTPENYLLGEVVEVLDLNDSSILIGEVQDVSQEM